MCWAGDGPAACWLSSSDFFACVGRPVLLLKRKTTTFALSLAHAATTRRWRPAAISTVNTGGARTHATQRRKRTVKAIAFP